MKFFKKVATQVKEPGIILSDEIANQIAHQRGNTDQDFPSDFSDSEINLIKAVRPYTMTSIERLVSLCRAVDYIEENKLQGDIVECGVWKGGSMMVAAKRLLEKQNLQRNLFLFDTYEGMSAPSEADQTFDNKQAAELLSREEKSPTSDNIWCYSTIEEVKTNLINTGYPTANLHFIKGKVEDTLPYDQIQKIAVLRLDTDWYESTKHELECLYDKLVVGGVLIIDDYGHWSGAKKAVDEFIKIRKLQLLLTRVDYTCRMAIKLN